MKKLFALILAMCLAFGATTALADTQEIKIGRAAFSIPAKMEIAYNSGMICYACTEDVDLFVMFIDWDSEQVSPELLDRISEHDIHVDNMISMFATFAENEDGTPNFDYGRDVGYSSKAFGMSQDMPDGECVRICPWTRQILVASHYYNNTGVLVVINVDSGWGRMDMIDEVLGIAEDVMLSFRLDGIAESDVNADSQVHHVIITADSGKIRTEASISGGLIKTAYKGETYELIREEGDWYVVDVNGRTGYIHKGVASIQ